MVNKQKINTILVEKRRAGDLIKIEKIIDSVEMDKEEEEKRKDAAMDEKIHSWNPNRLRY